MRDTCGLTSWLNTKRVLRARRGSSQAQIAQAGFFLWNANTKALKYVENCEDCGWETLSQDLRIYLEAQKAVSSSCFLIWNINIKLGSGVLFEQRDDFGRLSLFSCGNTGCWLQWSKSSANSLGTLLWYYRQQKKGVRRRVCPSEASAEQECALCQTAAF